MELPVSKNVPVYDNFFADEPTSAEPASVIKHNIMESMFNTAFSSNKVLPINDNGEANLDGDMTMPILTSPREASPTDHGSEEAGATGSGTRKAAHVPAVIKKNLSKRFGALMGGESGTVADFDKEDPEPVSFMLVSLRDLYRFKENTHWHILFGAILMLFQSFCLLLAISGIEVEEPDIKMQFVGLPISLVLMFGSSWDEFQLQMGLMLLNIKHSNEYRALDKTKSMTLVQRYLNFHVLQAVMASGVSVDRALHGGGLSAGDYPATHRVGHCAKLHSTLDRCGAGRVSPSHVVSVLL